VSQTTDELPKRYQLTISDHVSDIIVSLARQAKARGDGETFLTSLKEFKHRLLVYPQFGDPLLDLQREVGQLRIGIIPPIAMRYGVLEERRMVFVAAPPILMPMATSSG
jgi:hypothetical protein